MALLTAGIYDCGIDKNWYGIVKVLLKFILTITVFKCFGCFAASHHQTTKVMCSRNVSRLNLTCVS